jgi:hypothetical protein
MNATATSTMTISGASGAWSNNGGTFNPSTGTVIFTNAAATMAGVTSFYNVTISSGATLLVGSQCTMRIAGTMTNNGTWHAAQLGNNTVEYNGGDQTVLNPNGLTPGYDNLILSGSGNKTLGSITAVIETVEISGTVKFNLTYTLGTSTSVGSLTFGGVLQAAGTWGSSSSGATHQDDTHFQGTGELNVSTGTADHITITSSTANLGSGGMRDITAEIRDANGNVVTSDNSTVVTFTQTSGGGSVSGTGGAAASSGIAIKTVTGAAAGSVTLTASAAGLTSGATTFSVSVGGLDHFAISTISSPRTAGTAITGITLTAQDANDNTVTSFGGTVAFGGTAGVTGTSAAFSSGVLGSVTVTPTVAGGGMTFTVSDGSGHTGSATITVTATTATVLAFTTSPAGATAGSAFSTQPVVKTQDAYGNNSTVGLEGTNTVTVAIKTGTGTLQGTTSYNIGTDGGNGTFAGVGLRIDQAGSFTLSATMTSGLTESDSSSFTVSATSHSAYKITAASNTPAAGATDVLTITAVDQYGNTVTSVTGVDESLTFSGLSNTLAGTVPTVTNKSSVAANQGTATAITFTNGVSSAGGTLVAYKAEGPVTLNATDGTHATTSAGGAGVSLTVGTTPATVLAFTTQPAGATAGSTLANVVVQIQDQYGNNVSQSGTAITLTLNGSTVYSGTNPRNTDTSGKATFNDLVIRQAGTDLNFTANATGPLAGASDNFDITAGVLNNFLVEASIGGDIAPQTAGTAFNIKITARDAYNNAVTGFTGTVQIASSGILTGSPVTSGSFLGGVLASQSVTITSAQSETTVSVTESGSGANGSSDGFTVNPATGINFLVEASGGGDIGPQTVGAAFGIRITARNSNNSTASGFTGRHHS